MQANQSKAPNPSGEIPPAATPSPKVATTADVCAQLRKGKTWLWGRLKIDKTFPRPFYLSPREPMFLQHEIDAWITSRAASRGAQ